MTRMARHGMRWGVPMNCTVYVFDKEKKELVLVDGPVDDVFHKNAITFGKVGWKVVDGRIKK